MSEALGSPSYRRVGYPIEMREQMVGNICERLAMGEPLAAICRDADMPSYDAVWDWQRTCEATKQAIARAREHGEDYIALEATEIIDGLRPVPGVPPDPARDKARAEVRLKLLAKFNPKRWGDNVQLRHADADGGKLDTAPLVNELLTLMPGGAPLAPGAQLIEQAPAVRNVTPAKQIAAAPAQSDAAKPSPYRPRLKPRADDVEDLV